MRERKEIDKQVKERAKRYFIQQKTKEILFVLLIVSALVFIPYLLGHFIGDNSNTLCGDGTEEFDCSIFYQWLEGFTYLAIVFFSGLIIIVTFIAIRDWINSNWNKAIERARKEMMGRKRK